MPVKTERIQFAPYGDCIRLTNDIVDLVMTLEVGPRVMRYGFVGKENMFLEQTDILTKYDENRSWKIRGGHRLWHTPEKYPRNYVPDDSPLEWESVKNGVKIIQPLEEWTQIYKEMVITLDPDSTHVKVVHTLKNRNAWPIEFGLWAMSTMAPGGTLVVPQGKKDTGVECNRVLSLWPYSDMRDKRVMWGKDYIFLHHDANATIPFKFGINHEDGWAAYINYGTMFMKQYQPVDGAVYPDYGSSFEAYTCSIFTEVESLSPLKHMNPGESAQHTEYWGLFEQATVPQTETEADLLKNKLWPIKK